MATLRKPEQIADALLAQHENETGDKASLPAEIAEADLREWMIAAVREAYRDASVAIREIADEPAPSDAEGGDHA